MTEEDLKIVLANKDWDVEGKVRIAYSLGLCDGTIQMSREFMKLFEDKGEKKPDYDNAFKQITELLVCLQGQKEEKERMQYWYDWFLRTVNVNNIPEKVLGDLKTHYVFSHNKKLHIEQFEPVHDCKCFDESRGEKNGH